MVLDPGDDTRAYDPGKRPVAPDDGGARGEPVEVNPCELCGGPVDHLWHVPEQVWAKISPRSHTQGTDNGGIMCVSCASRQAEKAGFTLIFHGGDLLDQRHIREQFAPTPSEPEKYTPNPKARELAESIVLSIVEGDPSDDADTAQRILEGTDVDHVLLICIEDLTEAIERGLDDALFDGVFMAPREPGAAREEDAHQDYQHLRGLIVDRYVGLSLQIDGLSDQIATLVPKTEPKDLVEIRQWRRVGVLPVPGDVWRDHDGTDEQWKSWAQHSSFERRIVYMRRRHDILI